MSGPHPALTGPAVEGGSPGRKRMDAAQNEFAKRMLEKPVGACMVTDPTFRFFYDPPEMIQIAFGGRPWFLETGTRCVHRIGLHKGLGWELDPVFIRQDERGITGVRITARAKKPRDTEQLYDMEFLNRDYPEDHMLPSTVTVIDHRPGLTAARLKPVYGEVLGEHVL